MTLLQEQSTAADLDREELAAVINQALTARGERSWFNTHKTVVIQGRNRYVVHSGFETSRGVYAQVFKDWAAPEPWAYSFDGPVLAEATTRGGALKPASARVEGRFLRLYPNGS